MKSLTGQTYTQLEIILVDDGSTDHSLKICERYAEKDSRICLISKRNGGVSSARNEGLHRMTGQWVTFVDADDWLETDIIKHVCDEIEENCDYYHWGIIQTGQNEKKQIRRYTKHISMEEIYCAVIPEGEYYFGFRVRSMGANLFRADIIRKNNIFFDEDLYIGEDAVFILKYLQSLASDKQVKLVGIYGYHYRILNTSSVRRYKSDLLEQNFRQVKQINQILDENHLLHNRRIQTSLTVLCWQILYDLILNMYRREENGGIIRCKDAICWLKHG